MEFIFYIWGEWNILLYWYFINSIGKYICRVDIGLFFRGGEDDM